MSQLEGRHTFLRELLGLVDDWVHPESIPVRRVAHLRLHSQQAEAL